MRCLGCRYDLKNLPAREVHRCPECGRAFDPGNPHTFEIGPFLPAWVIVIRLVFGVFLICIALTFALNIVILLGLFLKHILL